MTVNLVSSLPLSSSPLCTYLITIATTTTAAAVVTTVNIDFTSTSAAAASFSIILVFVRLLFRYKIFLSHFQTSQILRNFILFYIFYFSFSSSLFPHSFQVKKNFTKKNYRNFLCDVLRRNKQILIDLKDTLSNAFSLLLSLENGVASLIWYFIDDGEFDEKFFFLPALNDGLRFSASFLQPIYNLQLSCFFFIIFFSSFYICPSLTHQIILFSVGIQREREREEEEETSATHLCFVLSLHLG